MAWKQVKSFNLSKMGTKKGYCLQNVRLAFGLPAKYASAKLDMEANKKAGTLHDISSVPTDVAVPVYVDTSSQYEHVMVCDHGTYYSDGKKLSSVKGFKFFGWGELCEDVRIVEYVEDKKSNEEIANEVIAGKWGNGQDRKNRLEAAGYNYADVQKIVDQKVKGSSPAPAQINVGDTVIVNGAGTASSNGSGAKTRSYSNQSMKVISIVNGRYGCNQYNQDGGITGWWTASQVRRA